MILTNYHTHCNFCDGKGSPGEYAETAKAKGFTALGFSSHAPLPFPNNWTMKEETVRDYCAAVRELKNEYAGSPEVYLGMEIDYIPNVMGPKDPDYDQYSLDYVIGSVHHLPHFPSGRQLTIDGPMHEFTALLEDSYEGDIQKMTQHYYRLVREMLEEHTPDIIGHIDLIMKKNRGNRFFDYEADWYKKQVMETLETVRASGAVLEINTGAVARGNTAFPYPAPWIIRESKALGVPITINADAHRPRHVDFLFQETLEYVKETGFRELRVLTGGEWRSLGLE